MDPERFAELGVPEEFYTVKTNHVEVAWWLLEEMIDEGDLEEGEIVEQYPSYDGQVVERTPQHKCRERSERPLVQILREGE